MSVPRAPHLIDELGRAVPLAAPITLLGRSPDCAIVIADAFRAYIHSRFGA